MLSFRTSSIIFLVIFNLFYIAVGFYRFLFSSSGIDEDVETNFLSLYNIRIILCFLTGISGLVIFCTKKKLFKIFVRTLLKYIQNLLIYKNKFHFFQYLIFLIIGLCLSCYKILGTRNFTNNTELRDKILETVRSNKTDTSFGILLDFYQTTKKCCGVNGPKDYLNLTDTNNDSIFDLELPKSCCNMTDGFVNQNELESCFIENAHQIGCWRFLYQTNRDSEMGSFKLNLMVLSAQCLATILTLTLFKKEDIYY